MFDSKEAKRQLPKAAHIEDVQRSPQRGEAKRQRGSEEEEAEVLLRYASALVQQDDAMQLQKALEDLDLDSLSLDDSNELLAELLNVAAATNSVDSARVLVNEWEASDPQADSYNFIRDLYLTPLFTAEMLTIVAKAFPETTFDELVADLARYDSNDFVPIACDKLVRVYGLPERSVLEVLLQEARSLGNSALELWLLEKYEDVAPLASHPSWVQNFEQGGKPTERELLSRVGLTPETLLDPVSQTESAGKQGLSQKATVPDIDPNKLPTIEEAAQRLLEDVSSTLSVDDFEKAKKETENVLRSSSGEQLSQLLSDMVRKEELDKLQDDTELFRILGPANPSIASGVQELRYGGWRMFSCTKFDFNSEEDKIEDWFTGGEQGSMSGNCMQCRSKILARHLAVRLPHWSGGWKGCFCSWDCAWYWSTEQEPTNELSRMLLSKYSKQVSEIGIQDRIVEERS